LVIEHAQVTADAILKEGYLAVIERCDVKCAKDVGAVVEKCVARFGRIDVLVNNVGLSQRGGPVELDEKTWDEQIEINLKGAYLACKAVLPIMEKQGAGSIVNISSVAGLRYVGKPQVAYAAAKAGLMQFSRTTAVIYASKGIRLNCVVPGLMHTPLIDGLAAKYAAGDIAGFVAHRNRQVPMGRMGDAWDVAHATLFLAADESRYVTGTEIIVDGGLVAATS
jgi:NAD(P)-dependent dehydrogenase (short-subunit alcohol dehydrogenase family)